jgi:hypothetical protein
MFVMKANKLAEAFDVCISASARKPRENTEHSDRTHRKFKLALTRHAHNGIIYILQSVVRLKKCSWHMNVD